MAPDLTAAYRALDVTAGADEAAVRHARMMLVKVWHPDRHANDPALLAHAQRKLVEINEAFEAVRTHHAAASAHARAR